MNILSNTRLVTAGIASAIFLIVCLVRYFPIFCRHVRDRYRHFKLRRDRAPYQFRPHAYVGRVRAILSEAAQRAERISGKYGIDDFVELLKGDRRHPRIWTRITVSPGRIVVVIEYIVALDMKEKRLVNDIRGLFIEEYVFPQASRPAPPPRDYEFSRSFE